MAEVAHDNNDLGTRLCDKKRTDAGSLCLQILFYVIIFLRGRLRFLSGRRTDSADPLFLDFTIRYPKSIFAEAVHFDHDVIVRNH